MTNYCLEMVPDIICGIFGNFKFQPIVGTLYPLLLCGNTLNKTRNTNSFLKISIFINPIIWETNKSLLWKRTSVYNSDGQGLRFWKFIPDIVFCGK